MITPIDVIDSAVKIGLGAFISGLATYWLAKANHLKTTEKERSQRKRELLEEVAQQIASFDQILAKRGRAIAHWLRFKSLTGPMSEAAFQEFAEFERELSEGDAELKSAGAKLWLLGEIEAQGLLSDYAGAVELYPPEVVAEGRLTTTKLNEDAQQLREIRRVVFAALSEVYKRT